MKRLIFTALIILSQVSAFAGGGWTQEKGKSYWKFGQYLIFANSYYTPSGDIIDITSTGFYSTSIYGELGITNKLTGIINFPFFVRGTLNRLERPDGTLVEPGDELSSIGDIDLTLKYGIFKKGPYVGSLSLTLGLPLGNPSGGNTKLLQTGDGEFNQMLTLDVSRSFGKGNLYASSLVAFNNRTENFSDEFRFGVEFGAKIKGLWFINRIYGVESLNNGNDAIIVNNSIFSNNIEYLSYSPELAYDINDKVGVSLGAGFAFSGKRVLADPAYSAGIYLKL